jgi:hypothetical protein
VARAEMNKGEIEGLEAPVRHDLDQPAGADELGPNGTSAAALGLGSFAVASAIFLILELSQPYTGLFRIPAASMEQTLAALEGSAK